MIKPLDANELLEKNKIVTYMSGSRAYGTSTPESDTDIRGLFLADQINIRTPFFKIEECNIPTEEDTKYYELTHFMKLLLNNNPNIVESLWVEEKDIIFKDSKGCYDLLRSKREDFLCSKVAFTYSGYAYAQLKRHQSKHKQSNKLTEFYSITKKIISKIKNKECTLEYVRCEYGEKMHDYILTQI